MSIIVKCQCGKSFKAKESLAGKKVRCPNCQQPVRIPDTASDGSGSGMPVSAGSKPKKAGSSAPAVDAEAALLKFEEVQRRKAADAEAEAAYRAEQNKLIESYDQIAGKSATKDKDKDDKKKKSGLSETGVKKPTVATKTADAVGTVFGTLIVKYLIIAALIGGGAWGSVHLVRFVTGYMGEETAPQVPQDQQIKNLFSEALTAANDGKCTLAESKLKEVIRLDPGKEMHNSYIVIKKKIEERRSKNTCQG